MLIVELFVLACCGLVLLLASLMVLLGADRAEVSLRSLTGLFVGAAGAGFLAFALTGETVKLPSLLLAVGVSLLIVRHIVHKPHAPMRRLTDWMTLDD